MGAKQKLNAAHLNGSVIVAGLLGLVTDSVAIFALALAILVVTTMVSGGIRR